MSFLVKKLLLIDGSNLAFRMYYALERTGLTSPSGKPSWAVFGFFKALLEVIEKEKPDMTVACFDPSGGNFRKKIYDYYKANRPTERPEPLSEQWSEILKGLELIGIKITCIDNFEADDVIGALAKQAENQGWQVIVFSGDKDLFQLANPNIQILMPSIKGTQKYDSQGIKIKMGVLPEQIVDYKALCGDSSDNIKGVPGIGEKTAIKLLNEFHSLENIYENIENVGSKSLQTKLLEGRELAEESKFLAQISFDSPIALDFENIGLKPKFKELSEFLTEYKLATVQRKLNEIFPEFKEQLDIFTNNKESKPINDQHNLKINRRLITLEEEFDEILLELEKSPYISLDLETTGLDTQSCEIVGWAIGWGVPEEVINSCYIPVKKEIKISEKLSALFAKYTGKIFVQNVKFEYKILQRYGLKLPRKTLDTMLGSYIENPEQPHGLKAQSLRVFNYRMTEITELIGDKNSVQKTMDQVTIEKISDYACDDAAITLALGDYYLKTLSPSQIKLWEEIESPLALLLADMENRGIEINTEIFNGLSQEISEQIKILEKEICKEIADNNYINLNSGQQLAQALINKGFKLKKKTSSGLFSTDMRTLENLKSQDEYNIIEKILEYKALTKLKSTYTDSLSELAIDKRIHTEFNQALTSTGRLSSSNPNLQNIPIRNPKFGKIIRSAFVAGQDKLFICADYSQIELKLLAHYTEDPILLSAFQNKEDIHSRTASEIFDIDIKDVDKDMRRIGKTLNFALVYQQGIQATAKQLGISNAKASEFIEKYFKTFSQIKPFLEETLAFAHKNKYVETLWGRRRFFQNLNSHDPILKKAEERAAFNARLQGSAADMIKIAMLRIEKDLADSPIVLQVHDELIIEVIANKAEELKEKIRDLMCLGQPLKVPIEVDIKIGANWAEAK